MERQAKKEGRKKEGGEERRGKENDTRHEWTWSIQCFIEDLCRLNAFEEYLCARSRHEASPF